jgi:hypothetical protein
LEGIDSGFAAPAVVFGAGSSWAGQVKPAKHRERGFYIGLSAGSNRVNSKMALSFPTGETK